MKSIYYESQDGILCRKHAINAYFGYEKITVSEFYGFQNNYDSIYKKKFNIDTSCKDFDVVSSDQKNLVSYILKEFGVYTKYYAINELYQQKNTKDINEIINILDGNFFFIYNESHIYGASQNNNIWYTVDSIGGINTMNINHLTSQKNIGFIVPTDHKKEFYKNISMLKYIIGDHNIQDFLIQKNKDKLILDNLEIPLSICIDILEYQMYQKIQTYQNSDIMRGTTKENIQKNKKENKNMKCFEPIYHIIIKYKEFLTKFTKGRYNDITLILEYLPTIISFLINITL
jgi:hypothetical protein